MPLSPERRNPSVEVRYVPHPLFSLPDARAQIQGFRPEGFDEKISSREPAGEIPPSSALGKLLGQPVLSRAEERYVFLRMNYEKFAAQTSKGKKHAEHLAQATAFRDRILLANVRLLVSIAGQFASRSVPTEDWVSEGVVPLLNAIELFDVSRGYAFGTYATHVLRNHFHRTGQKRHKHHRRAATLSDAILAEVLDETTPAGSQEELARRQGHLAEECLALLPEVDQTILRARFGFDDPAAPRLRSYAEIGAAVGLSKERVRVRTHRALEQLKETAQDRRWDLPELETLNLRA